MFRHRGPVKGIERPHNVSTRGEWQPLWRTHSSRAVAGRRLKEKQGLGALSHRERKSFDTNHAGELARFNARIPPPPAFTLQPSATARNLMNYRGNEHCGRLSI
jgi:hypothetical protein